MTSHKKIELIVSDIEGCLMPADRKPMMPGDLAAIEQYCVDARDDGHKWLPPLVFCSGRQIPYAECLAQMTGAFFPGFPSVIENGAFLYDVARNQRFQNEVLRSGDVLKKFNLVREKVEEVLEEHGGDKEAGKEICISLNPPQGLKIDDYFELVIEYLNQQLTKDQVEAFTITHSESAVDITPVGVDKGSGLRELAKKTGIALENMLGLGDTRGDLPMLELVGTPACPANASTVVKDICEYISEETGTAGVTDIISHFTGWKYEK